MFKMKPSWNGISSCHSLYAHYVAFLAGKEEA